MNLDARARNAAASLRSAVEATAAPSLATVAGRRRFDFFTNVAVAGAAAIAVFFLAAFVRGPQTADVAQPSPDTTAIVVETTTTTTMAETTTTVATTLTTVPPPDTTSTSTTTTTVVETTPTSTTTTSEPPDTTPPSLAITVPVDGAHTEVEVFQFRGHTDPGATVFSGIWQADVDAAGNWALVLVLAPGPNTVRFTATDAAGNEASATVTVHYDEPGGGEEGGGEEFVFTAHQTYGSCAEDPPYDVFYGTGVPGTLVAVASPHGGGSTEVDDMGNWEIYVEFPEAPFEELFEVVVEGEGGRKVFSFIRTG